MTELTVVFANLFKSDQLAICVYKGGIPEYVGTFAKKSGIDSAKATEFWQKGVTHIRENGETCKVTVFYAGQTMVFWCLKQVPLKASDGAMVRYLPQLRPPAMVNGFKVEVHALDKLVGVCMTKGNTMYYCLSEQKKVAHLMQAAWTVEERTQCGFAILRTGKNLTFECRNKLKADERQKIRYRLKGKRNQMRRALIKKQRMVLTASGNPVKYAEREDYDLEASRNNLQECGFGFVQNHKQFLFTLPAKYEMKVLFVGPFVKDKHAVLLMRNGRNYSSGMAKQDGELVHTFRLGLWAHNLAAFSLKIIGDVEGSFEDVPMDLQGRVVIKRC